MDAGHNLASAVSRMRKSELFPMGYDPRGVFPSTVVLSVDDCSVTHRRPTGHCTPTSSLERLALLVGPVWCRLVAGTARW